VSNIFYGSNVAAATVTTAGKFAFNATGGTDTQGANNKPATTGNGYIQLSPLGGSQTNNASVPTTLSDSTFEGWMYDSTGLEGQVIQSGTWTWNIGAADTAGQDTGVTLVVQFWKRSSGAVYTQIGSNVSLTNQTVTTTRTNFTFTSGTLSAVSFGPGDKLCVVMYYGGINFLNTTSYTIPVWISNSATAGVTNDAMLTTPAMQVFKDVTMRGNVHSTVGKDITLRGKLQVQVFKDITTRGKVSVKVFKDITMRAVVSQRLASGGFTLYSNGTGTAQFDTFRVTQMPDPSLSLSTVGRAGSSVVAWNATLPTNTTLGVDTSLDGVNWTDVSALNGTSIPGIFPQPNPTNDLFTSNSSANYTSTFGTGGSVATWTYDTAHSRVAATGGTEAIFMYGPLPVLQADITLLCDMDQSDAGGLVWRAVDQNNYYKLVVGDSAASVGTPNRATLYRVAAGVQTQLAQASITFPRGTYHRFKATQLGGVITASMDGESLFSFTDGSPLAAGKLGLYNNGGTTGSRYYQLWFQPIGDYVGGINSPDGILPSGDVVTAKFVYVRHRLGTSNANFTPQVLDTTLMVSDPNVGAGVSIPSADYRYTFVDKNLDDLAKQSNYAWFVDQNKALHFSSRAAVPAPWILQSVAGGTSGIGDIEVDTNLQVEVLGDQYRNRQVLTGVTNTGVFSETFAGDGQRTSFTLQYPIVKGPAPTVTLNSNPQTIGLKGTTGSQWYYAVGDATIAQDSSGTVLASTDRLTINNYTGTFITTVVQNNTAAQAALAAIEGGTGIVESVVDVSKQGMLYAAAQTYAQQLLTRYSITGRTITFKTYRDGLAVGQLLPVFLPEENLFNAQLLITSIDITMQTKPGNAQLYSYLVTATELPNKGSWQKLLASGLLLDTTGGPIT